MKKRVMTFILAFLLALSMATPVFASEESEVEIKWLDAPIGIDASVGYIDELGWLYWYEDGREKYLDAETGEIVNTEFDLIFTPFHDGITMVDKHDAEGQEKRGYIDTSGSLIIPMEYNWADWFYDGLACVSKTDSDGQARYGFIDTDGNVVVPLEYTYAGNFCEGLAYVRYEDAAGNRRFFYIDTTGSRAFDTEYVSADDFHEGLACVAVRDAGGSWKYGYIDTRGNTAIPFEYDSATEFNNGLAMVGFRDNDGDIRHGVIDTSGKLVVPAEYDDGWVDEKDWYITLRKNVSGEERLEYLVMKDATGVKVVPEEYDFIDDDMNFDNPSGLLPVQGEDGKIGFVDRAMKMVIPYTYDRAGYFIEGMAQVAMEDGNGNYKWGYIDTAGSVVVPIEYDTVKGYFSNGVTLAKKTDNNGEAVFSFIDTTGATRLQMRYDRVEVFEILVDWQTSHEDYRVDMGRWGLVWQGDRCGIFEIPDFSAPDEPGIDSGAPVRPTDDPDEPDGSVDSARLPDRTEQGSGRSAFPVVLVVVLASAVLIIVVLLVLLLKKKKPAISEGGYCPNCGMPVTAGSKFCPNCGQDLSDDGQ